MKITAKNINFEINTDFIDLEQVKTDWTSKLNATGLEHEIFNWEQHKNLEAQITVPFNEPDHTHNQWRHSINIEDIFKIKAPLLFIENTIYAQFAKHHHLNIDENEQIVSEQIKQLCQPVFTPFIIKEFDRWLNATLEHKTGEWAREGRLW